MIIFVPILGAQHGIPACSTSLHGVRGSLRRTACSAAHSQRASRPGGAHRRARLRFIYREVFTRLRTEILSIDNHNDQHLHAFFSDDRGIFIEKYSTLTTTTEPKILSF